MKERPIIMTAESVQAILENRKTQTRRVIFKDDSSFHNPWFVSGTHWQDGDILLRCPYGVPGDRLWVKETWAPDGDGGGGWYRAGVPVVRAAQFLGGFETYNPRLSNPVPNDVRWRPSIFMPRWASRITLEIVSVRVERVREISANDACAEGVLETDFWKPKDVAHMTFEDKFWDDDYFWTHYPQMAYSELWNSINAKRGYGWQVNPWVWVIEFGRK